MIEARFQKVKDTKNCVRYDEIVDEEPPMVGALYVKKYAINKVPANDIIIVTIKGAQEK